MSYKIHLNHAIALLFALTVFVSGVEVAKNASVRIAYINVFQVSVTHLQVGCMVITVLLHYFFLAVFSLSLCEGIIYYVMAYESVEKNSGSRSVCLPHVSLITAVVTALLLPSWVSLTS